MVKLYSLLLFLTAILLAKQVQADFELKDVYDVYINCAENKTLEECLSVQIISSLEKLEHQEKIPIIGGLELVRNTTHDNFSFEGKRPEDVFEESKSRGSQSAQEALDQLILKKIYNVLKTHTLGYSSEEERRKSNKVGKMFIPLLFGMMFKLGAYLPMVLSFLKVIAFKALLASKMSLMMSVMLGMKKLVGTQREHHGSPKPYLHHIYGSPAVGYGDLLAGGDLLHEGSEHSYKQQQLSDSRSEYTDFTREAYGRSLQGEDTNNHSKLRKRSINNLHHIDPKTRSMFV